MGSAHLGEACAEMIVATIRAKVKSHPSPDTQVVPVLFHRHRTNLKKNFWAFAAYGIDGGSDLR
jgi:hypothetical protein